MLNQNFRDSSCEFWGNWFVGYEQSTARTSSTSGGRRTCGATRPRGGARPDGSFQGDFRCRRGNETPCRIPLVKHVPHIPSEPARPRGGGPGRPGQGRVSARRVALTRSGKGTRQSAWPRLVRSFQEPPDLPLDLCARCAEPLPAGLDQTPRIRPSGWGSGEKGETHR